MAPNRRTGTVHGNIATAHYYNTLACVIRDIAPADFSQHIHGRINTLAVYAFYIYSLSHLSANGNINRVIFLQKLLHGNIPAHRCIIADFNISRGKNRIDILIQSVLGQSVIGNTIAKHAASLFPFLKNNYLMPHQGQIISCCQSGGTAAHNRYLLSGCYIAVRHLYLVCCNLVYRKLL